MSRPATRRHLAITSPTAEQPCGTMVEDTVAVNASPNPRAIEHAGGGGEGRASGDRSGGAAGTARRTPAAAASSQSSAEYATKVTQIVDVLREVALTLLLLQNAWVVGRAVLPNGPKSRTSIAKAERSLLRDINLLDAFVSAAEYGVPTVCTARRSVKKCVWCEPLKGRIRSVYRSDAGEEVCPALACTRLYTVR